MLKLTPPLKITALRRGQDAFGSGHFHASRGERKHQGVDFLATKDSLVHAILAGKVSKLGYTYADDLSYRYVEVTDSQGYRLRYYYVSPLVAEGDTVKAGDRMRSSLKS